MKILVRHCDSIAPTERPGGSSTQGVPVLHRAAPREVLGDNLIVVAQVTAGYLLVELASWGSGQPGIHSFSAALSKAHSMARVVDVPEFGLAWTAFWLDALISAAVANSFGINLRRFPSRAMGFCVGATVCMLLLIGLPFQDRMLAEHMRALGYTHCSSGDFYRSYSRRVDWYLHYERGPECLEVRSSKPSMSTSS